MVKIINPKTGGTAVIADADLEYWIEQGCKVYVPEEEVENPPEEEPVDFDNFSRSQLAEFVDQNGLDVDLDEYDDIQEMRDIVSAVYEG